MQCFSFFKLTHACLHFSGPGFQIFYIFMYLMSFIFVTYTNVFILKRKSRLVKFLLAIISRVGGLLRNKSDKGALDGRAREEPSAISRCSFNTDTTHLMYTGSFPLRIGAVGQYRYCVHCTYIFMGIYFREFSKNHSFIYDIYIYVS